MQAAKKLLILAPHLSSSGGVASYVQSLRGNWSVKEKYFFRGNAGKSGKFMRPLLMLKEYLLFVIRCIAGHRSVMVNTSMDKKAHIRDSVFILIASLFRKKIFVFVHGWDQSYFESRIPGQLTLLFKAKKIFVLSTEFKRELLKKEYKGTVIVETTVVENNFMEAFPAPKRSTGDGVRFLFLARLENEKGVMLALEAFQQLATRHDNIYLDIAGFGSMEQQVKTAIETSGLKNITYHGLVKGNRKIELFRQADVYLLPTSHGEGMPISVLEAMAAGLSVITTSAGALNSFFHDGAMGYKMTTATLDNLRQKMEAAIIDGGKVVQTGAYNHAFARERFTVAKVISRLEKEILHA